MISSTRTSSETLTANAAKEFIASMRHETIDPTVGLQTSASNSTWNAVLPPDSVDM